MLKSRVLTGALVTGTFVIASMFAAAPANAAPLPAGQQITVLDADTGQFYDAHHDTAALTAIGTGNLVELEDVEVQGIDVDDSGLGYAVGTYYDDGAAGAYLFGADANTGTLTLIAEITILFSPDQLLLVDECMAVDYTDGALLIGCNEYGADNDAAYIGYWDFDDGLIHDPIELTGNPATEPNDGFDFAYLEALAVDPISGLIYVFAQEYTPAYVNGVYTASEDAGLTLVSNTGAYQIAGADFDRGGQLWATANRQDPPSLIPNNSQGLATVNLATGALPFQEPWADQGPDIQPLTVWGGLPATGPAESTGIVVGAAAFLLFGAILAVGATARRRATES